MSVKKSLPEHEEEGVNSFVMFASMNVFVDAMTFLADGDAFAERICGIWDGLQEISGNHLLFHITYRFSEKS